MPVITLFQTKGGTGKTTAAFVIAELLAKQARTTVIDADQNEPFREWQLGGGEGQGFEIVAFKPRDDDGNPTGEDVDRVQAIPLAIKEASQKSTFVIVDTEGSANAISARAVALSDLVIVTSTGSPLDQKAAKKAIQFIRMTANNTGKAIPYRVLFTRQKAVAVSRTIKKGIKAMIDAGVPVFDKALIERDAFMAIFGYNATIFNLPKEDIADPAKGYFNGKVLSIELLEVLEKEMNKRDAGKTDKKVEAA